VLRRRRPPYPPIDEPIEAILFRARDDERFARHWAGALECLRPVLATAVVDVVPSWPPPKVSPVTAAAQRDAAGVLTQMTIDRASRIAHRHAERLALEVDLTDETGFRLVRDYGPCSINVDVYERGRPLDQVSQTVNQHDGASIAVRFPSVEERGAFLDAVERHGLDPLEYVLSGGPDS
jgi:hypothetical protein